MNNEQTLWIIIGIAAVVLIAAIIIAVVVRSRKTRVPQAPKTSQAPVRGAGSGPSGSADVDSPRAHSPPAGGVAVEDAPAGEAAEPAPAFDTPAPAQGRLARLRARLVRSNNVFGKGLLALLSSDKIDEDVWDEVEMTLLAADLGTDATDELIASLRERVKIEGPRSPERVRQILHEELLKIVDPTMDRELDTERKDGKPSVILVVGVNGVGKTTTIGKIARVLVAEDKDVLLGAADTFRAAAADQLQTWGSRVGVPTVRSDKDGADPASVAFDAVDKGIEAEVDTVLVDTAGRLQNRSNLMDELGKIKRVINKRAEVREVLLVLDATTGQNGLSQAKVFSEVVDVTGIVLTKLDGTAKGGIVVAIQRQLGVPVKLVGLGEGPDDLAPFEPEAFVEAILD